MPRELFDAEGKSFQVPDENELKAFQEAQTKVADLEKQMKELEADANPDWRNARNNLKKLEDERNEWKAKAEKAGVEVEPKPLPTQDIEKIAEKAADKRFLEAYKNRVLQQFGDQKEAVGRFFDKFAQGEDLNEEKINEFVTVAARAAGINSDSDPIRRAIASSGTSAPNFDPTPKDNKDFSQTEAGKTVGAAMGLTLEVPKK